MPDEGRLGSVARRLAATLRVMSIEDEQDIADFLRAYFRASGYDLVHVNPETALEVLEAVDKHKPDCVLLDLGLRGFSGEEAYRLLRTDDRYALIPVIVVSARSDASDVVEVGGIDTAVVKPFNVNTLADVVAERIAEAQVLRTKGRPNDLKLLTQEEVQARIVSALAAAPQPGATSFALLRLCSLDDAVQLVGDDGAQYVVQTLLTQARAFLGADAVLGLTQRDELAILLPDTDAREAAPLLTGVIDEVSSTVTLPGGAEVEMKVAVGLAAHPEHGGDADELYMAADAALTDACESGRLLITAI